MNISRESWHYKILFRFLGKNESYMPKTLCGYFWSFFFYIVYVICLCIVYSLAIFLLALVIYTDPKFVLLCFAIITGSVATIGLIAFIYYITTKPDSVIAKYIISKKNKVCTLISYKD